MLLNPLFAAKYTGNAENWVAGWKTKIYVVKAFVGGVRLGCNLD